MSLIPPSSPHHGRAGEDETPSDGAPSALKGRVVGLLSHAAWNGIRGLVSIATLILTCLIALVVQAWIADQERAHLSIQDLRYSVSPDRTEWSIQAEVDNNGPRTATDLIVETTLRASSNITLTSLSILTENGSQHLTEPYRASTTPWPVFQPPDTLAHQDIELLHYKLRLDHLPVGDSLVVSASFETQQVIGEDILRALANRSHRPLTNPHGAGPDYFEHAHSQWKMQVLRAHFVHDVAVAGDAVLASKSTLWDPVEFR